MPRNNPKNARRYSSRSKKYFARRKKRANMRRTSSRRFNAVYAPRKRKIPRVRVSAPATVVAQTYYANKIYPLQRKMMKKYSRTSSNYYSINEGFTITSGTGQQNTLYNNMMSATQMRSALVSIGEPPANANDQLADTNRIFWRSAEAFTTLTNSSNCTAFVDIYHFTNKRDTNQPMNTLWTNGLNDETSQTAEDYTRKLGVTPTMSQAINDYYKIKKVYQIVLAPGQSHQHNTKRNIYRVVNNDIIATDMGTSYLAGLTHWVLYVARGAPATDSATPSLVNTGPVKIDVVRTFRCSMTYLADNDQQLFFGTNNNLAAAGSIANVVNTIGVQTWNSTTGQTGYQVNTSANALVV